MKAVVAERFGGLDALAVVDRSEPVGDGNDVLIDVKAASLNPIDFKIREGKLKLVMANRPPIALGCDVAGVVSATGGDVRGIEVGDEVFARLEKGRMGGLAERVAADASVVAKKPKRASWVEAAAVPLAGLTALQALRDVAELVPGQRVLIHAGAGGVGSLAQLDRLVAVLELALRLRPREQRLRILLEPVRRAHRVGCRGEVTGGVRLHTAIELLLRGGALGCGERRRAREHERGDQCLSVRTGMKGESAFHAFVSFFSTGFFRTTGRRTTFGLPTAFAGFSTGGGTSTGGGGDSSVASTGAGGFDGSAGVSIGAAGFGASAGAATGLSTLGDEGSAGSVSTAAAGFIAGAVVEPP
jgi:hypothetical protein